MLLENKQVDPHWALPQVKAMSRKLHRLTQCIRQPFGSTPSSEDMFPPEMEDTADDFAAGPVQALVKHLIQSSPAAIKTPPNRPPVKRKADPFPQPVTPSTRKAKKKAKLVFRGNKAKSKAKKAKTVYRPDLGPPILFDPATPSTSAAPLPTTPSPPGKTFVCS